MYFNSNYLEEDDLYSGCSGNFLCCALLKALDVVLMKPLEPSYTNKVAVINALKALLTISNAAKMTALESEHFGFFFLVLLKNSIHNGQFFWNHLVSHLYHSKHLMLKMRRFHIIPLLCGINTFLYELFWRKTGLLQSKKFLEFY